MNIAICDGDAKHTSHLQKMIARWQQYHHADGKVFVYEEGDLFWASRQEDAVFDLVFIRTRLQDMTGMALAKKLRAKDKYIDIAFLADDDRYAVEGYEVGALAYLLKPAQFPECVKVLDQAYRAFEARRSEVFQPLKQTQMVRVLNRDISYIEVFLHYVVVHAECGEYRLRLEMKQIEIMMPRPMFFRCHRSYIVNMRMVRVVSRTQLTLDDGSVIPVARARWRELCRAFIDCNSDNDYMGNVERVRALIE